VLQAIVGRLQLLLLRLQLGGERLRLVQQVFRLHVRRDGCSTTPMDSSLVEEGLVDLAELRERRQLDHRFHLPSNSTGRITM